MMDMWNWLVDCYEDGYLTCEDLEAAMKVDSSARRLWEEFSRHSDEFVNVVREEVKPFLRYVKSKKK